jgi:hypothetical protein
MRRFRLFGANFETAISGHNPTSLAGYLSTASRIASENESEFTALFADFDDRSIAEIQALPAGVKRVLVRNEPKVVRPQNHKPALLREIDFVVDIGRPPSSDSIQVNWPQTWDLSLLESPEARDSIRSNRVALINANKLSFVPGELYSLRRQFVYRSGKIDTWGPGWRINLSRKVVTALKEFVIAIRHGAGISATSLNGWFKRPQNYLGLSASKLQTLSGYNYSLVIENSMEFMTEKLFDSLFAGTYPIYVGPKLEFFGIPGFVASQASADFDSVSRALENASDVDLASWRKMTLEWLKSEGVEKGWSSSHVLEQIINTIDQELDSGRRT